MVIDRLRQLIGDNLGKNVVRFEPLQSQVNGTNATFYVSRFLDALGSAIWPLFPDGMTGPFYVTADGSPGSTVDSYDLNTGYFVLAVAPTKNCQATYYWQYFADADLNNWLNNDGIQFVGGGNFLTADAVTPVSLQTAIIYLVASMCFTDLAGRAAAQADKKAGELSANYSSRAKAWTQLAKDTLANAYKIRDDYYTRQGEAAVPQLSFLQQTGDVDQWTPAR